MQRDEVERFLDDYVAAFDALDAARVASLYDEPCVIVDRTATSVFMTQEELRANLDQLVEFYRAMGYCRALRERTEVAVVAEKLAVADVAWCIETSGAPVRFTTRYTIAKRRGALCIAVAVAGDEGAVWSADT